MIFGHSHIHVTIRNKAGSVEHYWHFMLGFFLPLISFRQSLGFFERNARIYIRSCGPMDRHLAALGWKNLVILDRQSHLDLPATFQGNLKCIHLDGMDLIPDYQFQAFANAASYLRKRFGIRTRSNRENQGIVLINRGESDRFYLEMQAEVPGSANLRRSLPNITDIYAELEKLDVKVTMRQLEHASLAEQISLFQNASIIIFQHGAVMANLIFCKPNATVIEILPENANPVVVDMASTLCQGLALKYARIPQQTNHSAVDPQLVLQTVKRYLG